jgi:hypothetical protein
MRAVKIAIRSLSCFDRFAQDNRREKTCCLKTTLRKGCAGKFHRSVAEKCVCAGQLCD